MKKETIGVITKLELMKAPKGHTPHLSGTGAYRNRRRDKKLRRIESKQLCKG